MMAKGGKHGRLSIAALSVLAIGLAAMVPLAVVRPQTKPPSEARGLAGGDECLALIEEVRTIGLEQAHVGQAQNQANYEIMVLMSQIEALMADRSGPLVTADRLDGVEAESPDDDLRAVFDRLARAQGSVPSSRVTPTKAPSVDPSDNAGSVEMLRTTAPMRERVMELNGVLSDLQVQDRLLQGRLKVIDVLKPEVCRAS